MGIRQRLGDSSICGSCWVPLFCCVLAIGSLSLANGQAGVEDMPDCDSQVPCSALEANSMSFRCRSSGPEDGVPVVLLHGFPEFSVSMVPLLKKWASEGQPLRTVACDLRGYSPGAAPSDPEDYDYATLVGDVYAIADASGFDKFHLVGHDHGAGLAWLTAATDKDGPGRVLSLTAMSVPHPDTLSKAIYGPEAVEAQVVASNYFRQFQLPDSASRNDAALAQLFASFGYALSPEILQPQLWWYYGSIGRYIAAPPVVSSEVVAQYPTASLVAGVQQAIPLAEDAGSPASTAVGPVAVPTLFVCGEKDPYLLCSEPWAFNAADVTSNYTYYGANCQHGLLTVGATSCMGERDVQGVMAAITSHIMHHTSANETGHRLGSSATRVDGSTGSHAVQTSAAGSLITLLLIAVAATMVGHGL